MSETSFASAAASVVTDTVDGLFRLHEPVVQIAIWQRPVDPALRAFAQDVLAREALEQVLETDVAGLATWSPLPGYAELADPAGAAAFTADVRWLTRMFADLTGATRLGVRLVRLQQPMCPRFHTDFVGVRLLTTYCGAGTEWLADEDVDRRWLGHRSGGVADANSGLLRPGAVVQRVPEFAVALCKGEAWPGNAGRGAVHRSPAVGGSPRILLSIDVLAQEDGAAGFDGFDATGEGVAVPASAADRHGCHDGCGGHA